MCGRDARTERLARARDMHEPFTRGIHEPMKIPALLHSLHHWRAGSTLAHRRPRLHPLAEILIEVRTLHKSHVPGIIAFTDAFYCDAAVHIILEYMDCGSLASVMRRHGPLPEPLLARVSVDLLGALDFLHRELKARASYEPLPPIATRRKRRTCSCGAVLLYYCVHTCSCACAALTARTFAPAAAAAPSPPPAPAAGGTPRHQALERAAQLKW